MLIKVSNSIRKKCKNWFRVEMSVALDNRITEEILLNQREKNSSKANGFLFLKQIRLSHFKLILKYKILIHVTNECAFIFFRHT